MTTYVKLVKGATKIKMAPPKSKYIDPILLGTTQSGDFQEIMDALQPRINDSAWTVVYKALIILHLLIRDGEKQVALDYLSESYHADQFFHINNNLMSQSTHSGDVKLLQKYSNYLKVRTQEFSKTKKDFVKEDYKTLRIVIDNNNHESIQSALDQVDSLELQVEALIKVRFTSYELSNELFLYSFKLLVYDLLPLYNALNEGIITLLESFFELSHSEADTTLQLYKRFVTLTDIVVKYLKTAKNVGLRIPIIKHITTKLVKSLQDHLAEDNRTHNTFNQDSTTATTTTVPTGIASSGALSSASTFAQQRLEEIRKQKALLEQQLANQHILLPSQTGSQSHNPFMTAENQMSFIPQQITNNPFVMQSTPQTIQQPIQVLPTPSVQPNLYTASSMPVLPQQDPISIVPSISTTMTQVPTIIPTMTSTSQQIVTSNMTNTQNVPTFVPEQIPPLPTGSNNPFALNNIEKEIQSRQEINPFSKTNYTESNNEVNNKVPNNVSNNPFSLVNNPQGQQIQANGQVNQLTTSQYLTQTQQQPQIYNSISLIDL
ncbi:hypothetical protein RI543_000520 [Arxiozyma heterogenica]|uniref:ENTH domain-containing protein n=1 Tax=Arxiozyma heterogenica TaxID=278026 RepID=A0AAN7WN64_9SACH|nr:hypothetical protein RI543_000520 [Kazachstania heterogenica]